MIKLKNEIIHPEDVSNYFKKYCKKMFFKNFLIGTVGLVGPISLLFLGEITPGSSITSIIFAYSALIITAIIFPLIFYKKAFENLSKSKENQVDYYVKNGLLTVKSKGIDEHKTYHVYLDGLALSFQNNHSSSSFISLNNKKADVYFLKETREVFIINVF